MQGDDERLDDDLPAIELEIDDDFSMETSSIGSGKRWTRQGYGQAPRRRRCCLIWGLVVLAAIGLGVGLGIPMRNRQSTKGLQESVSKSVEADGEAATELGNEESSTTEETATEVTTKEETTTVGTSSETTEETTGEATEETATEETATESTGETTDTSTDETPAPFPGSNALNGETVPPPFTFPSPSPYVTTGRSPSPYVTTGQPTPKPHATVHILSPTPPPVPVVRFTVTPVQAPVLFPVTAPFASTAAKTEWPELVGTPTSEAAWIIREDRSDINVVFLYLNSGVDSPPTSFQEDRVVIFRNDDGIIDQTPYVG